MFHDGRVPVECPSVGIDYHHVGDRKMKKRFSFCLFFFASVVIVLGFVPFELAGRFFLSFSRPLLSVIPWLRYCCVLSWDWACYCGTYSSTSTVITYLDQGFDKLDGRVGEGEGR